MVEHSDAFIAMPGGLGTLDETFEILTWKYLGLHEKPVIMGNINGYWSKMLEQIRHMISVGYTPEHHLDLFDMADNVEEIINYLNSYDIEGEKTARIEKM